MKLILFDMDGTIIDPILGFVRCINYALSEMKHNTVAESELEQYIGPPLDYAFEQIVPNSRPEFIQQCIIKYRERFLDIGWQENHLYPEIEAVFQTLIQRDYKLAVCTSRRQDFAQLIISHQQLDQYFEAVIGADFGIKKSDVVKDLIDSEQLSRTSWMIGDRHFDMKAASLNGLRSVAVLWGYGSKQELSACSPTLTVSQPEQLKTIDY